MDSILKYLCTYTQRRVSDIINVIPKNSFGTEYTNLNLVNWYSIQFDLQS